MPEAILRRLELGLDLEAAGRASGAWWLRLEHRVEVFVQSHLPANAREVELALDEATLAVVVRFRVGSDAADGT